DRCGEPFHPQYLAAVRQWQFVQRAGIADRQEHLAAGEVRRAAGGAVLANEIRYRPATPGRHLDAADFPGGDLRPVHALVARIGAVGRLARRHGAWQRARVPPGIEAGVHVRVRRRPLRHLHRPAGSRRQFRRGYCPDTRRHDAQTTGTGRLHPKDRFRRWGPRLNTGPWRLASLESIGGLAQQTATRPTAEYMASPKAEAGPKELLASADASPARNCLTSWPAPRTSLGRDQWSSLCLQGVRL